MKYRYVLVKILPFLFISFLDSVTAQIRADDSSFSDQEKIGKKNSKYRNGNKR